MKCHVAEACLGGLDSLCADGYSGRRCGQCVVGYHKITGLCRECSSQTTAAILLCVLVLCGLFLTAFFEWQTLRDPRVGSPIVLLLRVLEALGIFALCVAHWPGTIPAFLAVTALVNLNTEVFQTECLLGQPHPTRAALMYACGIPVLLLVLLLFYPLLQLRKRYIHYDRGASPSLESMCESLMPGKAAPGTRLPFTPIQALKAANFKEYVKIALTVRCRAAAA